jgi:protein phosphatase
MGGHENGEVASGTVCESFAEYLKKTDVEKFNTELFNQALDYAYDQLDKKDQSAAEDKKMGTTLTFLCLNNKGAFMAHIGDSRIYHLRKTAEGVEILYKSQDHSLVNDLIRAEVITPEEAKNHPKKNIITRVVQPNMQKRSKADIRTSQDVQTGDYFFLCTDGVLESVNDSRLIDVIAADTSIEEKTQAIYALCKKGSKDNFSAYLIEIAEGIAAEPLVATEIQVVHDAGKIRKLLYAVILLLTILIGVIIWSFLSTKEPKENQKETIEEKQQDTPEEKSEPVKQDTLQPAPSLPAGDSCMHKQNKNSDTISTESAGAGEESLTGSKTSLIKNVENAVIANEVAKKIKENQQAELKEE